MRITDPANLIEPTTFSRYWLTLESEVQHQKCVVERSPQDQNAVYL